MNRSCLLQLLTSMPAMRSDDKWRLKYVVKSGIKVFENLSFWLKLLRRRQDPAERLLDAEDFGDCVDIQQLVIGHGHDDVVEFLRQFKPHVIGQRK